MTTITDAQWQAVAEAMDRQTSAKQRLIAGLDKLHDILYQASDAECKCLGTVHEAVQVIEKL